MLQNFNWHVGTIVPLVIVVLVALFAFWYFRKWKKFVQLEAETLAPGNFYHAFVGFYSVFRVYSFMYEKYSLKYLLFKSRYIRLLNSQQQRLLFEINNLSVFSKEEPLLNYSSFYHQWSTAWSFCKEGEFTFHLLIYINDALKSKLYLLYKNEALFILRKKGYFAFSEFMSTYYNLSKGYPVWTPFSIIYDGLNQKIIMEYDKEITERVRNTIKENSGNYHELVDRLRESYVLKNANGKELLELKAIN